MKVRAIKLKDMKYNPSFEAPEGVWDYDDFFKPANKAWHDGWISWDCLLADPSRNTLWIGLAAWNSDIFWAFDRKTRKLRSMNYRRVGNRYDAKFHRSLLFDKDGIIWAATALYHDIDRYFDAPGGAIVRFDPNTNDLKVVARPFPHVYIQSIQIDAKRGLLYGQTYTPEFMFVYDMATGQTRDLGPLGSGIGLAQAEQLSIDRNGTVWGQWGAGRAWANAAGPTAFRLFKYHPDEGKRVFLDYGLPHWKSRNGMGGFVRADGTHTGPDGAVYMGTGEGVLCRIDPDSEKVEAIGKPAPGIRLAGMANGPDGKLYGSVGKGGNANLFSYDPRSGKLENLGPIFDEDIREQAYQVHNMAIFPDGTIYCGENDVPFRSSYLWEITGACKGKKKS